jgi:hypothetical protein
VDHLHLVGVHLGSYIGLHQPGALAAANSKGRYLRMAST